MKTMISMNKIAHFACRVGLCVVVALAATGCETTGDPNAGGIFWSEKKAQDRLYARQNELNALNRGTRELDWQNRQLQSREAGLVGSQ